eukprot:s1556_g2.t1
MEVGLKSAWGQGGTSFLSTLVQLGASFVIVFYGGNLALHHEFDVGTIITFSYLWNRLSSAFTSLNENINQPVKAVSAGQRVFELLDLKPDIQEDFGEPFPDESKEVGIRFENVSFAYQSRQDKKVLSKITLDIRAGKTTAVVGKSGCGKSTVSKLLLRFYDPQSGAVFLNASELHRMHLHQYRSKDVENAAKLANAHEFIEGLPEGYNTMVGEGGHDLSGGQKQRLSIARALVRRPRILLLDEATSALDAENEAYVQAALDDLMKQMQGTCTIMIIAHRLSTIKDADWIIVLHEGQVAEEGSHDQLLQIKDGRYATLINRQLNGNDDADGAAENGDGKKTVSQALKEMLQILAAVPKEKRMELFMGVLASTVTELHMSERLYIGTPPGVVMGLAWTANGGATLYVEARGRLPCGRVQGGMASLKAESVQNGQKSSGSGHMQVTGQLGSVMSESSSISLTYARLFMRELDPENTFLDAANIHLHVPEGATPKDGPSAGVTMTSALLSCALERSLKADVAMTGELTLMGKAWGLLPLVLLLLLLLLLLCPKNAIEASRRSKTDPELVLDVVFIEQEEKNHPTKVPDELLVEEVAKDIVAGANEGAQILVLVNMENSPILEKEKKKASEDVQTALSRPPVVEYWKGSDQACCCKLLDLMMFPIDANAKRPNPNKKATFRQKENPVVLYLSAVTELLLLSQDAQCAQALTALANLVSPISKSGDLTRTALLLMLMAECGTVKTLVEAMTSHVDSPLLQGDACCAIVNISQDEVGKKKVNELGGFQQMLQSQKRFEFNPEFWDMRWGMKELKEGDTVNYRGGGRWVTGSITRVNRGNGAYDVSYMHGGNDRKDMIDEFVAVWQWKPQGKLTEDELTLKSDGMLTLKSEGLAAAGTWNVTEPKGGGRNIVKINLSGSTSSIEMERISLTTLRALNGPQRAVLKDSLDDCLYVEYFEYPEGLAGFKKPPPLLGRKPDLSRSEQQIDWVKSEMPWTGLPSNFGSNFAARLGWKGIVEITKMGNYKIKMEAATSAILRLNDKIVVDLSSEGSKEWEGNLLGGLAMFDQCHSLTRILRLDSLARSGLMTFADHTALIRTYDYEDSVIPEGVDPDIVRTEKQLDFEETEQPWQGLPARYGGAFAARFTTYVNVTCGDQKKAKYQFMMESGARGILYIDDKQLSVEDKPVDIELKKGQHLIRVDYFCHGEDKHGLKLFYRGPETMPKIDEGEEVPEGAGKILVPPTATCYYALPS